MRMESLKRIACLLMTVLCIMALSVASPAWAASASQPDSSPDLTRSGSVSVSSSADATYSLWKVADMKNGSSGVTFSLISQLSGVNVDLNNLSTASSLEDAAVTLYNKVAGTGLRPAASGVHVSQGVTALIASGLSPGMYLLQGKADPSTGVVMNPTLVYLPSYQSGTKSWLYDVTVDANKFSKQDKVKHFRIVKEWENDSKYTADRPKEVRIRIKNTKTGEEYVKTLTCDDKWTYDWETKDAMSIDEWIITEEDIATGYQWSLTRMLDEDTITYTVINTLNPKGHHDNPPDKHDKKHKHHKGTTPKKVVHKIHSIVQTGDENALGLWTVLLCASGCAALYLVRRRKKNE